MIWRGILPIIHDVALQMATRINPSRRIIGLCHVPAIYLSHVETLPLQNFCIPTTTSSQTCWPEQSEAGTLRHIFPFGAGKIPAHPSKFFLNSPSTPFSPCNLHPPSLVYMLLVIPIAIFALSRELRTSISRT
jgi:hypothetical protein